MKTTRKNIRRIVRESVHGHLDGELTNLVFSAAQEVYREWEEITGQDILDKLDHMPDKWIASMVEPRLADYFVSAAREMTYEDIINRMQELVQIGELVDGYEDFFYMPEQSNSLKETKNPAMIEIESVLRRTMTEYIDTYMMSMNMNAGNPADRKRVYKRLESIASTIMG